MLVTPPLVLYIKVIFLLLSIHMAYNKFKKPNHQRIHKWLDYSLK